MTFRVMNKLMNNFKKQGNSIVIQLVNENVIPYSQKEVQRPPFRWPFFFD